MRVKIKFFAYAYTSTGYNRLRRRKKISFVDAKHRFMHFASLRFSQFWMKIKLTNNSSLFWLELFQENLQRVIRSGPFRTTDFDHFRPICWSRDSFDTVLCRRDSFRSCSWRRFWWLHLRFRAPEFPFWRLKSLILIWWVRFNGEKSSSNISYFLLLFTKKTLGAPRDRFRWTARVQYLNSAV